MTLLFESNRAGPQVGRDRVSQIVRLEIDANGQEKTVAITNADKSCHQPRGGPNGSVLFSASYRVGGYVESDICTVDRDGQSWACLATESDDYNHFEYPLYSPDYRRIVFTDSSLTRIQIMQADGTDRHTLIEKKDLAESCDSITAMAWTSDGSELILTCIFGEERGFDSESWIFKFADSSLRKFESGLKRSWSPVPAPNGEWFALAGRDQNNHIYKVRPDGSDLQQLTTSPLPDGQPFWSPDGSHIVFTRYLGERNHAIFVMNSDGSNPMQVTDRPDDILSVCWVPFQLSKE